MSRLTILASFALFALPFAACDAGEAGPSEPPRAERQRLATGKADAPPGTCEDRCGGHGKGQCWCDDLCTDYGDCCADLQAWCGPDDGCAGDADCADDEYCGPNGIVCVTTPCPSYDICRPDEGVNGFCTRGAMCGEGLACINNQCTPVPGDDPCYVGGCSGQLCTDQPGAISTCEWTPLYGCYKQEGASCERQADGTCGWTLEGAAAQCVVDVTQPEPEGCTDHSDCAAGEFCQELWCITTPCPWLCAPKGDAGAPCSEDAMCADGLACVDGACAEPLGEPCFVGGCSGQLCGPTAGMISTCEWKPEYACYKQDGASCERQDDGSCGWTMAGAAAQCLADAGAGCQPVLCELYCPYGFATDDAGCEVCACNPAPQASACEGHCGGQSADGCWCDDLCSTYGDCCEGKADTCG